MKLERRCFVHGLLSLVMMLSMGCGEDTVEDDQESGGSPVHALASVMRLEDSRGTFTEARLIVVTTATAAPEFVDEAQDVKLVYGGNTYELPGRPFELRNTRERVVMYTLTSRESELSYEAGETYTFSFELSGREAGAFSGETFTASVALPAADNNITAASEPDKNNPLDLVTSESYSDGIVEVFKTSSGDVTYVSYPYSERDIESVDDLLIDHTDLGKGGGSLLTVPAEAFNRSGTHTVVHVGLQVHKPGESSLSSNLGRHSVVFGGASAQLQVDIQ